jgi:D-amino-acid oxidase
VPITRREVVKAAALAALGAAVQSACALRAPAPQPVRIRRRFVPVRVSPDRVTRIVVGLRPFRPSGFRVEAERFDEKVVVHHYGHGGGGITLSWGSAELAVEAALATGDREVAVLGCGVIGLSTARLLQRRGARVTIYARDLPPETTSNVAGGQWAPAGVADRDRRTPAWEAQFERAARASHRTFQHFLGPDYGVRWIENYVCQDRPFEPSQSRLDDLYPEARVLAPGEHPFPARYVRRFTTMLIEPAVYLNALLRDFLLAGGTLVVRAFRDRQDVLSLPTRTIVNCTGLGARALFDDEELVPVKGQLTVLLPQPEVDYIVIHDDLYMFPRTDGVLLGGTRERGVWTLEPNPEAADRILAGHRAFFAAMRASG